MFDIYNPDTYNEVLDEEYAEIKGEILYNPTEKRYIKLKEVIALLQAIEKLFKTNNPDFKFSQAGINNFLKNLYEQFAPSQIKLHKKEDWISSDIKALVDTNGNPLSRESQGKIQVIKDSNFEMLETFTEEVKNKIKEIFLSCLKKREPKYRIRQELFDNFAYLNWDCYDFVDYELNIADLIVYIKEEVYNTKPGEKVYFKRFEMMDENICKKCKKLNKIIALWSNTPLDSNKIKDKYAKYAIWDDRFTEKKSKIPFTWCCKSCRGCWIRYYPELDNY